MSTAESTSSRCGAGKQAEATSAHTSRTRASNHVAKNTHTQVWLTSRLLMRNSSAYTRPPLGPKPRDCAQGQRAGGVSG